MLRLLRIGIGSIGIMVKKRGIKISMKVAIIAHFSKIQQIDEYSTLLNVGEDDGYSLGSQTDHDLSYVPLN